MLFHVVVSSKSSIDNSSSKSSSTSNSKNSANESYIPYSSLSSTVIKNGDSSTPWTYATALASWQKIFASYNYKDAVESALNSFFNDYANYQNSFVEQDYKAMNQSGKQVGLNYLSVLNISNYSFSYNTNNTFNLKFTIISDNYWIDINNNKKLLYSEYSTNIDIQDGSFGASFDSLSTPYLYDTSNNNYAEITWISASLFDANSTYTLIQNYNNLSSDKEILSLINSDDVPKYNKNNNNQEESNYSYTISKDKYNNQSLSSFISTYNKGINYGVLSTNSNSNN